MTNEQATAQHAQYPHLSVETIAYYSGRNAADFGDKCGFTADNLIAAWKRGYRDVKAEDRLSADTEWDRE